MFVYKKLKMVWCQCCAGQSVLPSWYSIATLYLYDALQAYDGRDPFTRDLLNTVWQAWDRGYSDGRHPFTSDRNTTN